MRLQFLGSGDAFGSGGRFNTCFLLDWSGGRVLIDCGASSLIAMQRAGVDPNDVDAVLVSHLHGDHFGGLPFLLLHARYVGRRRRRLTLAGPPSLRTRLAAAMEALFPDTADLLDTLDLDIVELADGRRQTVVGLAVTPVTVIHASGAPPYALRIEADDRVLCYSGDTEWTEALVTAARDADLFICECFSEDKPVPMHLDLRTIEAHLAEIRPKRLILTHMGPDMLARAGRLTHETAADGLVVEL